VADLASPPPVRSIPWLRQSAWALADQWLFSGANFIANILLARWLSPEAYGAYAFGFSLFLLFAAFHTAVLIDPMLVFGAGRYAGRVREYLGFLLRWHVALSLAAATVLAIVSLLASDLIANALLGAAIATPLVLLAWLLRRAFYVEGQPAWAAVASGLYLAVLIGSLLAFNAAQALTPATGFLSMALASLPVYSLAINRLRPRFAGADTSGMLAEHARYGRWSAATSLLIWVPLNIFFVILPYFAQLAAAAELRAVTNLLTPLMQSALAITILVQPQLSAAYQQSGTAALKARLRSALALVLLGSFLYLAILFLWHQPLLSLLYGGQYAFTLDVIILAGFVPVAFAIGAVLEAALRAMEQPRLVFFGYLVASVLACTVGFALSLSSPLTVALTGQVVAFVGLCAVLAYQLRATLQS
jgi:O-antigen/teichoic acid export membrane protein